MILVGDARRKGRTKLGQATKKMGGTNQKDKWLRRQAVQIASQLPEDPSDAINVLRYAHDIVERFLDGAPKSQVILKVVEEMDV